MILLVAATPPETELLREKLSLQSRPHPQLDLWQDGPQELLLLHTGIGMTNTAWSMGLLLGQQDFSRAINFGIAGTHDRSLALGTVVEVRQDCFAEMGADSPAEPLFLQEMGFALMEVEGAVFYNELHNPHPPQNVYPQVSALTVNRVSGTATGIMQRYHEWPRQVETMEGAAFFQVCLRHGVPFWAFRGLSNYVEVRDRSKWRLGPALKNVQEAIFALIQDLE